MYQVTRDGVGNRFSVPTTPDCNMCFQAFTNRGEYPVILKCGHCFGSECIAHWTKNKRTNTCPKCRGDPHLAGRRRA